MDPVMMFVMAMSGGLKAAGSIFKGVSDSISYGIQERIAQTNVELSRIDSQLAYTQGAFKQYRVSRAVTGATAAISTNASAHGLDPNYGSPLLAVMHSAEQGQLDKGLILAQSELDDAAAKARVATAVGQEASAKISGKASMIAGFIGAGAALLGGSAQWPGLSSASPSSSGGGDGFDLYGGNAFSSGSVGL